MEAEAALYQPLVFLEKHLSVQPHAFHLFLQEKSQLLYSSPSFQQELPTSWEGEQLSDWHSLVPEQLSSESEGAKY